MPADILEKTSVSPVAATAASMNTTPDKPKTASEHRKVSSRSKHLRNADILSLQNYARATIAHDEHFLHLEQVPPF